jgi:hypothetical protein
MHLGFWWGNQKERARWEDNIKIDLKEVGWGAMGWIDLLRIEANVELF